MPARPTLIFDFGNTLAPFNSREADGIDRAISLFVSDRTGLDGPACFDCWRAERAEDFRRSAATGEEHDFPARLARVLARHGLAPDPALLREAEQVAGGAFARLVTVPREIRHALRRLARTRRLGLLSNYLLSDPIRAVVRRDGCEPCFEGIVVSKEVGYAKPDRRAFGAILDALGVEPEEAVYVGDDLRNDVEGALACGMRAVWTWAMLEVPPEPSPGLPSGVRVIRTPAEFKGFLGDPDGR